MQKPEKPKYLTAAALIRDFQEKDYNYSITSNYSLANPVEEGSPVEFTITRDGSTASTVYLSTNPGTAKGSQRAFEILKDKAVTFAIDETEKTVSVSTYVDSESEEPEYFHLLLYRNS